MTTIKAAQKATVPDVTGLDELHCANDECGKFLGYTKLDNGLVNIKCHGCKTVNMKFNFTESMPATEVKCKECGRFLYLVAATNAVVVRKCRICGTWDTMVIDNPT
jgi:ribosomal protein S27E